MKQVVPLYFEAIVEVSSKRKGSVNSVKVAAFSLPHRHCEDNICDESNLPQEVILNGINAFELEFIPLERGLDVCSCDAGIDEILEMLIVATGEMELKPVVEKIELVTYSLFDNNWHGSDVPVWKEQA